MLDDIFKQASKNMKESVDSLDAELKKIRTGRANPEILDTLIASYYGVPTPLKEMASISVPEPTVIAVKPWDKSALASIETAIRNSDLGLSPVNDGIMVRLVLPPMTEERRKEIVKQIHKMGEEAKVSLRNIRGEAWSKVQSGEKQHQFTEDDRYQAEDELNKIIGEMNKVVDQIIAGKEKEIMSI